MSFKDLKLDQELIDDSIKIFCLNNDYQITGPEQIKNITRYKIIKNDTSFNIDFYYKADGTTTIHHNAKETSMADDIISYIIENITISKFNNFNIITNNASLDHYNLLINYLVDDFSSEIIEKRDAKSELMTKIKGVHNDEIIIKFYPGTSKLHIQGKPLHLYKYSYEFLSEVAPEITFIDDLNGRVEIIIDEEIIKNEMAIIMPKNYNKLHETVKSQIITSLNIRKISIALPDYSLFAFPALKGLEASIKLVLQHKKSFVSENKKVGSHFSQSMSNFVVKPEFTKKINCHKTCDSLSKAYTLYYNERHSLFHTANDILATRTLKENEANALIDKVIAEIDTLFDNITI